VLYAKRYKDFNRCASVDLSLVTMLNLL